MSANTLSIHQSVENKRAYMPYWLTADRAANDVIVPSPAKRLYEQVEGQSVPLHESVVNLQRQLCADEAKMYVDHIQTVSTIVDRLSETPVIPELTVKENLELGAIWRKNGKEMKESLDQVVTIFPRLGERISQRSDTLSGGERQMLAIGRAIMSKPKLLLLDEPSLGLAPLVVEQIFQTIRDLTTEMRLTVLLVEQNAMGALKIADLGIVLNLGKVVAVNHAQALIEDPAVRAAYLGY